MIFAVPPFLPAPEFGNFVRELSGTASVRPVCFDRSRSLTDARSNSFSHSNTGTGSSSHPCTAAHISSLTPSPAPTSSPTVPAPRVPVLLAVVSSSPVGACLVTDDSKCVTDGHGKYGNTDKCVFRTMADVALTATKFDVELPGGDSWMKSADLRNTVTVS